MTKQDVKNLRVCTGDRCWNGLIKDWHDEPVVGLFHGFFSSGGEREMNIFALIERKDGAVFQAHLDYGFRFLHDEEL